MGLRLALVACAAAPRRALLHGRPRRVRGVARMAACPVAWCAGVRARRVLCLHIARTHRSTRAWIRDVVVGLGLCPWAGGAYASGALRVTACDVADAVPAAVRALEDVAASATADAMAAVAVDGALDFGAFLDLCAAVDGEIDRRGHRGTVQLATFHPDYVFGAAARVFFWSGRFRRKKSRLS